MVVVRRGDVVVAAFSGDYGKPRPAVVVQTDLANETHASVVLCPITSHLVEAPLFRLPIEPSSDIGLNKASQVMVDKIGTLRRNRLGKVIGRLNDTEIVQLNRSLALWLGLGE
jgi:mRNA interferase MazF